MTRSQTKSSLLIFIAIVFSFSTATTSFLTPHYSTIRLIRGGTIPSDDIHKQPVGVDSFTTSSNLADSKIENPHVDTNMGPNSKNPPGFLRSTFPAFPWHTLPDFLTYIRCVAIPVFVLLFYSKTFPKKEIYLSLLFAGASFTDFLDGYLARRWDITSAFGAFLDPVADKLMVSTALILLSGSVGAKVSVPTAIILAREIAVSALREWMAQRGVRDSVKVGMQGKVKTAATMISLSILLAVPGNAMKGSVIEKIGMGLLYLSTLVTVTSGSVYFMAAAPYLMGKKS